MLTSPIDAAFYVFVTLIALINPISTAAVYVTLTEGRSREEQTQIANRATIVAWNYADCVCLHRGSALESAGVEIGAFKIAGGLLLLKVAFNMVFADPPDHRQIAANQAKATMAPASDPSVFPLAIPIITGPGALTASVALVNPTPDHQLLNGAIFVIVALIVIAVTYFVMRGSETLTKWFGQTGIDAVGRVVGIIVAAIAVQLVVNGVSGLTHLKIH